MFWSRPISLLMLSIMRKYLIFPHILFQILLLVLLFGIRELGMLVLCFAMFELLCFNSDMFSLPCDICFLCRQHKSPFPKSYIQSSHIFSLIHVDSWGLYTSFPIRSSICVTIVDYFGRATWTSYSQIHIIPFTCFLLISKWLLFFHINVNTIRTNNDS